MFYRSANSKKCALSSEEFRDNAQLAVDYHLSNSGSMMRHNIAEKISQKIGLTDADISYLSQAVELLHNASLIHDDIIDEEIFRRKRHSVWKKFGTNIAICSGDFLLAKSFELLTLLENKSSALDCTKLMSSTIQRLVKGQSYDLTLENLESISTEEYKKTILMKTSPLIALSFELPLMYGKMEYNKKAIDELSKKFALAYQLYDDLRDQIKDRKSQRINYVNILNQKFDRKVSEIMTLDLANNALESCDKNIILLPSCIQKILAESIQKLIKKINTHNLIGLV